MEKQVILSFDLEDIDSPAGHEEVTIVLSLLKELTISGSFLITGDKLRALVTQDRTDLLDGLTLHDIGFHSAHHSTHPTIPEYTRGLEWPQARALLKERELGDVEALRNIFGIAPSTFGVPGDTWVPYISTFCIDAGIQSQVYSPIQVPGFLPCEYAGIVDFGPPSIRWDPSVGDISFSESSLCDLTVIRIHPGTLVVDGQWDAENYKAPKRHTLPLALLTDAERALRLDRLRTFLLDLVSLGCSFTTFGAVCRSIGPRPSEMQRNHLVDLARSIERHEFPLLVCDVGMSLGQALLVLGRALVSQHGSGHLPETVVFPSGPIFAPLKPSGVSITMPVIATWEEFVNGLADAVGHIERTGAVNEHTFLGDQSVATTEVMYAAALAVISIANDQKPTFITIGGQFCWPSEVSLGLARRMAQSWRWPVLPPDFVMPQEIALALSQLWSLRPLP
jgi:hypothetical protein